MCAPSVLQGRGHGHGEDRHGGKGGEQRGRGHPLSVPQHQLLLRVQPPDGRAVPGEGEERGLQGDHPEAEFPDGESAVARVDGGLECDRARVLAPCSVRPRTWFSELLIEARHRGCDYGRVPAPRGAEPRGRGSDLGWDNRAQSRGCPWSVLCPVSITHFPNVLMHPTFSLHLCAHFVQVGEEHPNPNSMRLGFLKIHGLQTYILLQLR